MTEFLTDDLRVFVVPVDLLKRSDLTTNEKMVYVVLRSFCNPHTNEVFPGYNKIADYASMTRPTAIKAVKGLEEKGLLFKKANFTINEEGQARHSSNIYSLVSPGKNPLLGGGKGFLPPSKNALPPSKNPLPNQDHLSSPSKIKEDLIDIATRNLVESSSEKQEKQKPASKRDLTEKEQGEIFEVMQDAALLEGFTPERFGEIVKNVVEIGSWSHFKPYLVKSVKEGLAKAVKEERANQPKPASKGNQERNGQRKPSRSGKPRIEMFKPTETANTMTAEELDELKRLAEKLDRKLVTSDVDQYDGQF